MAKRGPYERLLNRVMATPGVRGALVVAVKDGLVVNGRVHVGVKGDAVAALAASLYRRALSAAAKGGNGSARFVELIADGGRILISGENGELALMAVVEQRTNIGQVRLTVRRAATELGSSEG